MACGIYKITNTTNGKYYIGSTKNHIRRFREHKSKLRGDRHCNRHLQNAWNKYGEKSFEFELIEQCSKLDLTRIEQKYLDSFSPYYNISVNANNPVLSKADRRKISDSLIEHYNEQGLEYVALSPSGKVIEFRNAREFARNNNLSDKNISAVCNGHSKTHKGWRFFHKKDFPGVNNLTELTTISERRYKAISPEGKEYTFNNATNFCKQQGLRSATMVTMCCQGKRKHYKKWTFEYIN